EARSARRPPHQRRRDAKSVANRKTTRAATDAGTVSARDARRARRDPNRTRRSPMNSRFHVVAGVLACTLALPVAAEAATVHVFFIRGEHGVVVHRPAPAMTPARAAVSALLEGPTVSERRQGFSSAFPTGSRLLGLTI